MSIHDFESGPRDGRRPVRQPIEQREPEVARRADDRNGRMDATAVLRLQRAAGNTSVARLVGGAEEEEGHSPVKDIVGSGGGRPLDEPLREEMEASFGRDFSDVRVHTDTKASESAQAVNAHAYTSGTDVVFQSGMYSPGSDSGKRMLAHELTHVVQQKAGPVAGSPAPGGIMLSDPDDAFEREADYMADKVMSGGEAKIASIPAAATTAGIQRQAAEEEEPVQGAFIQRQEEQEEEAGEA